jgi:O-antigen ligase
MTRLVHNDYLQQGSDSGLPGFGLFAVWVVGGMAWAYRYRKLSAVHFAVWIGLVGWAVQGAFEFGMFIPATAWPAMMLLGWLAGQEQSDRQGPDALLPSQHR